LFKNDIYQDGSIEEDAVVEDPDVDGPFFCNSGNRLLDLLKICWPLSIPLRSFFLSSSGKESVSLQAGVQHPCMASAQLRH